MTDCTLCGLRTPDPPVADSDVAGAFCCRGCLEVARTLDDPVTTDPADARTAYRAASDDDATEGERESGATGEVAYFAVDGMHCATCEVFLESRAADVRGVRGAAASYAGDALKVTYDPGECDADGLPAALSGYGYRVRSPGDDARDDGGLSTGARLLIGGFFGMMVMLWYVLFLYPVYLGRGPLVPFFDPTGVSGSYLLWNVAVLAGAATAIAGYPIFRGALVSLRTGRPNMDLLVALAAGAAFVYSAATLALGGVEVYFDVPVVVTLAVTAGDHWEAKIKRRAAAGLADRSVEQVDTARVRTASGVEERPLEAVEPGDDVVVARGNRVPLDGSVRDGSGAVDESLLTGESTPRDVDAGDEVVGGSLLVAGGLTVRVSDAGASALDRLVAALWDVQSTHGGVQRLADRLAAVFVPTVLALAALTVAGTLLAGAPVHGAVLTGLTVLVVSCPCALGLATPLAVSAGVRTALDRGVVFTDSGVFERAPAVDTIVFDKTGTLTTGEMVVTDVTGDRGVLDLAAALEAYADHPVARAVRDAATSTTDGFERAVTDLEQHSAGISGRVYGQRVVVGRLDTFEGADWTVPDQLRERAVSAEREGLVPVVVGVDGAVRTVAVVGDEPRPEWERVVDELAADYRIVVLTGDEAAAAERFRAHPGVDEVFAGVPPEGKTAVVERLREAGSVAMVGDGSNDAPALAAADVGIALADGTALAVDAADVAVTADSLEPIPAVFDVATATRRRVRQNLAWAFAYNGVAIPLAMLGVLNPLLAALAMTASSLIVVANSTRRLRAERENTEAAASARPGSPPAVSPTDRPVADHID